MLMILIHNDGTGNAKIGHYNVEVRLNEEILATGRIENYPRAKGWRLLAEMAVDRVKDVQKKKGALK